jgi:hypothetical protein
LGGSLFFGIDNDGVVKGLDDVQHVCETISDNGYIYDVAKDYKSLL